MVSSRRKPIRAFASFRALSAGILAHVAIMSAIGAAQAQYAYEPDLLLPPRAVVWRLNDRGFTDVTRPHFDGRAYVVEASNPYGDRLRLFVDARDGRIVGRQRLDTTLDTPSQVVRRAPGYGWTEDDEAPRRPIREAERIIPPADIPFPQDQARPIRPEIAGRSDLAARSEPGTRTGPQARPEPADRNPMGLNPDARGAESKLKAEAPRKVVRLTPAPKAAPPAGTPGTQKLSDVPPASPKAEAAPAAGTVAITTPPKAEAPATAMTPASVQPPPPEKALAQNWKDVPADAKRPIRVIGGATIVPGPTKEPERD
jgi:hypothetical protein